MGNEVDQKLKALMRELTGIGCGPDDSIFPQMLDTALSNVKAIKHNANVNSKDFDGLLNRMKDVLREYDGSIDD